MIQEVSHLQVSAHFPGALQSTLPDIFVASLSRLLRHHSDRKNARQDSWIWAAWVRRQCSATGMLCHGYNFTYSLAVSVQYADNFGVFTGNGQLMI